MAKIFKIPFATTGDKTAIPDGVQANGKVSYAQGFGFDYERAYTDPLSKDIPRAETNQIYNDITAAIGESQIQGFSNWDLTGAPYPINATVRHVNKNWLSTTASNSTVPGDAGATWQDEDLRVTTGAQNALNLKANIASPTFTGTVGGITKAMVGLGNVDNTSDSAKPVSTPQQAALNLKANVSGQIFTGEITYRGGGSVGTNTSYGVSALQSNTTGNNNTASGVNALASNTTGGSNTASGVNALASNTTGGSNTASGVSALQSNTTGGSNTASGVSALQSNTTGNNNTASGVNALASNTTGGSNTANGQGALYSNTTGNLNTASGVSALASNTTGSNNTASGVSALQSNTTGNYNTASGHAALYSNTTVYNCGGFGHNAQVTSSNQIQLGDAATNTYTYGAVQNRSDIRDKADARDTVLGLEFINSLRPVDYKWDMREDYRPESLDADSFDTEEEYKAAQAQWLIDQRLENITHDGSKKRSRYHHGFIAQEVQSLIDGQGIDFGGFQDHGLAEGGQDVLSLGYEEFIAPMVKAIQELTARVKELEDKP